MRKSTSSYWLVGPFFVLLIILATLSEFFQAPRLTSRELEQYHFLFAESELENLKVLKIKNRIGTFHLKKSEKGWLLDYPRKVHANKLAVQKILTSLKKIKIRKTYNLGPINKANFSLDRPLLTIEMEGVSGVEKTLRMGLINSIDNSTYITLSGRGAIFHVDSVRGKLEAFDLSDFIDSKIMSYPSGNLLSFKMFKGQNKTKPQLFFQKKNGLWYASRGGKKLAQEKVTDFLSHLYDLKGQLILDKMTDALQKNLDNYLKKSLYTMKIKYLHGGELTYRVSSLVDTLEGVKIDKKKFFIVKASNRDYPYLLSKKHLKIFSNKQRSFKQLSLKKLFY